MKNEDKVIKLLNNGKYEKARTFLLLKNDRINAKELYKKFEKEVFYKKYECVKSLVKGYKCYSTQLERDFIIFDAIYSGLYENIERLIDQGANPNREFFVFNRYNWCMSSCIDFLKDDESRKDKLIILMKKDCDIDIKKFNEDDENYDLANSYCTASMPIDLGECNEREIKEFALVARYGVLKKLKDAAKNDTDDDKTLKEIADLKEQIDNLESIYLGKLQKKADTKKQQKEEAIANRPKTKSLISSLEEKLDKESREARRIDIVEKNYNKAYNPKEIEIM